nr:MAG TPA: hypothetical protein [Caudoviricetes sp.]
MKAYKRNEIAPVTLTALTANTEKAIDWSESDERITLVIVNGGDAATSLTVKAGNGIQGVTDLTLTVQKGTSLVKLESGLYKNVSGINKGKVVVKSAGTPSVGVVALV